MAERIQVHNFIVCEDIRREDNGKLILAGVYTPDMIVFELPAILPKVSFYFLVSGIPSGPATVRVYSPHRKFSIQSDTKTSRPPEEHIQVIVFGISPFIVYEPGRYTILFEFPSGQKLRRTFNVVLKETAVQEEENPPSGDGQS